MKNLLCVSCVVAGLCLVVLAAACAGQKVAEPVPPTPAATPAAPLDGGTISGVVVDEGGNPVAGATVRIQATSNSTQSDEMGRYRLSGLEPGRVVNVSAWKHLYYCDRQEAVAPPGDNVRLVLRHYQTNDNPAYAWVPPTGENSCFSCKAAVTQVWLDNDAHGKAAVNPRFLTMYNGTDMAGNRSPLTRYVTTKDYGRLPLAPDTTKPYYGPGYKLDFPDNAGNCGACHIPGAALADAYGVDPNQVTGVDKFGVHCDFCHKVADVRLDAETHMPIASMPGVLSMDVRRPFPEDKQRYQLFFGTFDDDNVPMEDTKLPLLGESQFCAPCHFGVFWDTVVYNSYGEWLDSPYSQPQTGKTCQQCHTPAPTMVNGKALTNVAAGKGGVERPPETIHAHTFPGAASEELLRNALTMTASVKRTADRVQVEVTLTNDKTGHHVPSDSPLRHMILLVEAAGKTGLPLKLLEGEKVPEWGGVGDPQKGYYAGLPGKAFAKVLAELWTEVAPTGAYWNPTRLVSDNRLAAFASDSSRYVFAAPAADSVTVRVRLLYRRAYRSLADQKGWEVPDILMAEKDLLLDSSQ